MRQILLVLLLGMFCTQANGGVLYQQPADPNGGYYHSAWWDPDGSGYDEYVWDRFVVGFDADVDTIRWRGTYDPAFGGDTPVVNFTVAIYGSSVGGYEPDVAHPPLVEYESVGNAGETYVGVFGGSTMYDYSFALPTPFQAQADVPYWAQIEGWQHAYPGWSMAKATGGDGYHFRCQHFNNDTEDGVPTGCWFTAPSGDVAFAVITSAVTAAEDTQDLAAFALNGAWPTPSHGDRLELSFVLANSAPAQLALFSVDGRQVAFAEVGRLGAGAHVVDLGAGRLLEPGVYFARLTQEDRFRVAKVIVTR